MEKDKQSVFIMYNSNGQPKPKVDQAWARARTMGTGIIDCFMKDPNEVVENLPTLNQANLGSFSTTN